MENVWNEHLKIVLFRCGLTFREGIILEAIVEAMGRRNVSGLVLLRFEGSVLQTRGGGGNEQRLSRAPQYCVVPRCLATFSPAPVKTDRVVPIQ